jgi:hypothetical protein
LTYVDLAKGFDPHVHFERKSFTVYKIKKILRCNTACQVLPTHSAPARVVLREPNLPNGATGVTQGASLGPHGAQVGHGNYRLVKHGFFGDQRKIGMITLL